ncbi:MAG: hypothetical protein IPM29_19070 [Planctomycetes bacterium]|nr:hypothetical protein [Planctomycetota bacterium]
MPTASRPSFALVLALVGSLASTAAAQRGEFSDSAHGFSIQPPKDWAALPATGGDRGALVALWCSPKAAEPRAGGRPHAPALRVLHFAKRGAGDDAVDGLARRTPFRDFDDYLRRGHGTAARVVVRESVELDGGGSALRFEADVPRPDGARKLFGLRVDRGDAGELVVEIEVLEEQAAKERKEMLRTLASFALREPSGTAPAPEDAPWLRDAAAWRGRDGAAQRAELQRWAEARVAAVRAAPEPGWTELASDRWLVLSHGDARTARRAVQAADAIRDWAEKHLPGLGGAGTAPAVLRIYSDAHELRAVQRGEVDPREFDPDTRTLHFAPDPDAGTGAGYGGLFRAVVWQWIDDQVPGAMRASPRWLELGMWEYLRSTKLKGRGIEFFPSDVERGRLDYQMRNNSMPALWHLVQESIQPEPDDGAPEDDWGYTPECALLMRWLFDHDGCAAFGVNDLPSAYLRGIGTALAKVGPNPTADVDWALLDVADTKTARTRFYAWRKALREAVNYGVIPLDEATWRKANERWVAFAKESS